MNVWVVETLDARVDTELSALPIDMRIKFVRVSQLIEQFGPAQVGLPHVRSLGNKLWEIRVSGRDGIARGIYVVASERKVIVVHAFIKKTQETPAAALNTARKRAQEAGLL
jgi:phage-related protein